MLPSLQRIESEGKVFIVFAGGVEVICEINVPADGSLAAWSRIWERLEMTIGDTKVS